MNFKKFTLVVVVLIATLYACNNDDDLGLTEIPIRERDEQQVTDDQVLKDYLQSHFYSRAENPSNPNHQITFFDTIAGANNSETSIWNSPEFETKTFTRNDVEYNLYVLNFRRGVGIEDVKSQPTFADSTFVTYIGELLYDYVDKDGDGINDQADVDSDGNNEPDVVDEETRTDSDGDGIADDADADDDGTPGTDPGKEDSDGDGIIDEKDQVDNTNPKRNIFDSAVNPVWFDLAGVIEGFRESTIDFLSASGNVVDPVDGTVDYNDDYGDFVVFIPSGLAYFEQSQQVGRVYAPLIFSVQLYDVNESDHDNDGIPSHLEDLNGDGLLISDDNADNTDEDIRPNYLDIDDDGDGTPTADEITPLGDLNNDGAITFDEITFYDDDGDGVPNHLDPDDDDFKND